MGTTASPGLTPDLATPIPCESGGLWGTVQTAQGVGGGHCPQWHLRPSLRHPRAPLGSRGLCHRSGRPPHILPALHHLLLPPWAPQEEAQRPGGCGSGHHRAHHHHPPGERRAPSSLWARAGAAPPPGWSGLPRAEAGAFPAGEVTNKGVRGLGPRGATEVPEEGRGLRGGLGGMTASLTGPREGWPSRQKGLFEKKI